MAGAALGLRFPWRLAGRQRSAGSHSHVPRVEGSMAGMYHKPASIPRGHQRGISSPEVIATRGAWTPPWKKGPAGARGAGPMSSELPAVSSPLFQTSQISGCQEHLTDRAEDKEGPEQGPKVGWGTSRAPFHPSPALAPLCCPRPGPG